MTTQIMFKIDPKLKKAAQKRAHAQGITLSDFYQSATRSFVEGRVSLSLVFDGDNRFSLKKEFDDWDALSDKAFLNMNF